MAGLFSTRSEAEAAALKLGCSGAHRMGRECTHPTAALFCVPDRSTVLRRATARRFCSGARGPENPRFFAFGAGPDRSTVSWPVAVLVRHFIRIRSAIALMCL